MIICEDKEMDVAIPIIDGPQRLDLLGRQEFVDRMLTIANALSDNKRNACYAVNGDWGVGKSFVLDMFEEQAKEIGVEGEELSRYLIFRYNCWEYDYYDEPLVAMVASMLDQIDEKVDLLPADHKKRIVAALKVIGKGLVKKAVEVVNEKTGVDLEEAAELLLDGGEAAVKKAKESHEYDHYFDFKKNIVKLKATVSSLAEDQTVVFLVDELDRCLPEYTIKVLERLHHLFNDMPNVQVVLSIDIGQLEHIVHQIYGDDTDAKKYLRKLIQFELKLYAGDINDRDRFNKRFEEYTKHFKAQSETTSERDIDEFNRLILDSIDMRSRISVINRCELIHSILADDPQIDTSYMCLEILFVLLNDYRLNTEHAKQAFSISSVFGQASFEKQVCNGINLLSKKYEKNSVSEASLQKYYDSRIDDFYRQKIYHVHAGCLFGKLLCAYRAVIGFENDSYMFSNNETELSTFIQFGKKYWKLLQMIQ